MEQQALGAVSQQLCVVEGVVVQHDSEAVATVDAVFEASMILLEEEAEEGSQQSHEQESSIQQVAVVQQLSVLQQVCFEVGCSAFAVED